MPTPTFFNLSQEKKERLLKAAKKEFAHATFKDASINKIIAEAGISRGSFYMYFEDKKDLLYYCFKEYSQFIHKRVSEAIEKTEGDIFLTYIELFDTTIHYCISEKDEMGMLIKMFSSLRSNQTSSNDEIDMQDLFDDHRKQSHLNVIQQLNRKYLRLKSDEAVEDLLAILRFITKHSIRQALSNLPSLDKERKRFLGKIEMIQFGSVENTSK